MKEAHLSRHGLPDAVSTLIDRPIKDPGEEVQDEVHGSNANQGTITPLICEEMSTALERDSWPTYKAACRRLGKCSPTGNIQRRPKQ